MRNGTRKAPHMRKITTGLFVSLDGVVDADSDWQYPYFDDELLKWISAGSGRIDTVLMGRRSFAGYSALRREHPESPFVPFLERVDRYVAMQARFARAALDSDEPGVSRFIYEPGSRVPFGHRHREQEEAYVVVSGSGRVKLDDEIVGLAEWDVLRVAPCVLRAFEAGPDGLDVICIGLGNRACGFQRLGTAEADRLARAWSLPRRSSGCHALPGRLGQTPRRADLGRRRRRDVGQPAPSALRRSLHRPQRSAYR